MKTLFITITLILSINQKAFALFENAENMASFKIQKDKLDELNRLKAEQKDLEDKAAQESDKFFNERKTLSDLMSEKFQYTKQLQEFNSAAFNSKVLANWLDAYKDGNEKKMQRNLEKMSPDDLKMIDQFKAATSALADTRFSGLDEKLNAVDLKWREADTARSQARIKYNEYYIKVLDQKKEVDKISTDIYQCGEGDEVRLDQQTIASDKPTVKGPLFGTPVEDQDGMGVCYAAASTLVYHSAYPDDPLMSYVYVAMSAKGMNDKEVKLKDALDSGSICSALDAAKNRGFCPVKDNYLHSPDAIGWGSEEQSKSVDVARDVLNNYAGLTPANQKLMAEKGEQLLALVKSSMSENSDKLLRESSYAFHFNYLSALREDLAGNVHPIKLNKFKDEDMAEFSDFIEHFLLETYRPYLEKNKTVTLFAANALFINAIKDNKTYQAIFKAYNNSGLFSEIRSDNQDRDQLIADAKKVLTLNPELNNILNSPGNGDCKLPVNKANLTNFLNSLAPALKYLQNNLLDFSNLNQSILSLAKLIEPNCVDPSKRFFAKPTYTCESNWPPFKKTKEEIENRKKWMRSQILQSLYSDNPTAVGIGYCSYMLTDKSWHTDYNYSCSKKNADGSIDTGGHASVVIGVRKNPEKNECEYLIQNSWGAGCSQYYDPKKCESGKIWVGEEALAGNLMNIDKIQKSAP